MGWMSLTVPTDQVDAVQEAVAAAHTAHAAKHELTSVAVFSEALPLSPTTEIILSPEAAVIFRPFLAMWGPMKPCAPPTPQASSLYIVEAPSS